MVSGFPSELQGFLQVFIVFFRLRGCSVFCGLQNFLQGLRALGFQGFSGFSRASSLLPNKLGDPFYEELTPLSKTARDIMTKTTNTYKVMAGITTEAIGDLQINQRPRPTPKQNKTTRNTAKRQAKERPPTKTKQRETKATEGN